jgi:hypothetical protein
MGSCPMIGRRLWVLAACYGWMTMPVALGQDKPVRLVYDVASVRPSPPDEPEGYVDPLPGGIGYNAKNIPVKDMLSVMYRIPRR